MKRGWFGEIYRLAALVLCLILPIAACSASGTAGNDVAGDQRFYRGLAGGGGSEPLLYRSIKEMTQGSTVVVRARVSDVVAGRVINEEGDGRLYMIGVMLEPTEDLHGRWSDTYRGRLTVEFPSGSAPPDAELTELRDALPQGEAIWFLQSGADAIKSFRSDREKRGRKFTASEIKTLNEAKPFHSVVASEGVMVQGKKHVETPLRPVEDEDGPRPVRDEASKVSKLEEVSQRVRAVA